MSAPWEFKCPKGWKVARTWGDGYVCMEVGGGLRVIVDCAVKADGNQLIHVSFSRKGWTPNHADACKVKQDFIGDRYAYAVFPPRDRYVNIHEHCLRD